MVARFETLVPFALTVLLNAIWQPAVIAAGVWAILRILRNTNATTRHALWSWALAASFVFPFVTSVAVSRPHVSPASQPVEVRTTVVTRSKADQEPLILPSSVARTSAPSIAPSAFPIQRPKFSLPKAAALITVSLWLLAALVIVSRLLVSVLHLERLKRDSLPLPVEARERLDRWPSAPSNGRDVRVCVSPHIAVPVAIGLFDSMILLPNDLTQELDGADLDRVLLHELAHLRRCDDWVNLFERVVEALFFFSPGIHWISAQMDLEREVACDDWVLEQTQASLPYAQCLARIVERTAWPHRPVAAPGVFNTRRSMSVRIERLLARKRDARVRVAAVPAIAGVAATVAFAIASGIISPTIAYAVDSPQSLKPAVPPAQVVPAKPQTVPKVPAPAKVSARPARVAPTPCPPRFSHSAIPAVAPVVHVPAIVIPAFHVNVPPVNVPAVYVPPLNIAPVVEPHVHVNVHVHPEVNLHDNADPHYLDELQAAGYSGLSAHDVLQMRATGVDARYINELAAAGFAHLSPHQLSELRAVGVSGQYVSDLAKAGLANVSAREALEMRATGVDGAYVQDLRSAGVTDLQARTISEMRAMNVTGDYIRELANNGYSNLPVRKYVELRALGVDAAYLQKLRDHGFNGLNIDKVVEMKATGIPQ